MKTIDLTALPASEYTDSTFHFHEMPLKVFMIEAEPIFSLKQLCRCLEIENPSLVAKRLNNSEKVYVEYMPGRKVLGVTEPGLYETIFRSDKPNAKAFKDLVFGTILPAIRKTGRYVANESQLSRSKPTDSAKRLSNMAASFSRLGGGSKKIKLSGQFLGWNTAAGFLSTVISDGLIFEHYRYDRKIMRKLSLSLSTEYSSTTGKCPPKSKGRNAYPPTYEKLVRAFIKRLEDDREAGITKFLAQ